MDITIETALLLIVPLIGAFIVIGILTGQVEQSGNFTEGQVQGAECGLKETQFDNKCESGETPSDYYSSEELRPCVSLQGKTCPN